MRRGAHSFAGWAKEGQEAGRPGGSFARGCGNGVREGAAPGTGAFAPWAHSFAGWAKEGQEAGRPGGSFALGWSWLYGGLKNLRKDMVKRDGAVLPVGMGNFLGWGGNFL